MKTPEQIAYNADKLIKSGRKGTGKPKVVVVKEPKIKKALPKPKVIIVNDPDFTKSTETFSHDPLSAWKLLRDHYTQVGYMLNQSHGVDYKKLYNYKLMLQHKIKMLESHISIQFIEVPKRVYSGLCTSCVWEGVKA